MLYRLLKIIVRIAIKIFCRKIIVNDPSVLQQKGPLLLACNHPNSFLDGVILHTLFDQPLYSLARGDVFKKTSYRKLLTSLNLLPVYRISEGVENLATNYDTFRNCSEIFRKNGIVIIFSEGRCINEWHLRPLKKGTARLALACWKENIPLRVLPVGINYSSFRKFGKNVFINFGNEIEKPAIDTELAEGGQHQAFNNILEKELSTLVYEIDKNDREKKMRLLVVKTAFISKVLLFLPSVIGLLIHWPLYFPVQKYVYTLTKDSDHYDSILTAILLFSYPVYVILLTLLAFLICGSYLSFLLIIVIPITAWAHVRLKPQIE